MAQTMTPNHPMFVVLLYRESKLGIVLWQPRMKLDQQRPDGKKECDNLGIAKSMQTSNFSNNSINLLVYMKPQKLPNIFIGKNRLYLDNPYYQN